MVTEVLNGQTDLLDYLTQLDQEDYITYTQHTPQKTYTVKIRKNDAKLNKAKAPIYHVSMTSVWNECPNCKNREHIGDTKTGYYGDYYVEQNERCPICGQLLLWDWDEIEKVTKYSPDYIKENK